MAATEAKEREFTVADVDTYRDGDWIIVKLGSEVVSRRLTRDRAFTSVWVIFSGARSPEYPKTREHFTHIEHRGDWPARENAHWLRNRLEVPIRNA